MRTEHNDAEPSLSRPRLHGNGRPAQLLPVVRRHPDTGLPTQDDLRWGLIPHTARRRPDIQPIYARAESVAENRMFRDAYRLRPRRSDERLLSERRGRQTSRIYCEGCSAVWRRRHFWENWRDPDTRQWERTFATITVAANSAIAPIHDRMPAILRPEEYTRWLGPEDDPHDLLRPYPSELVLPTRLKGR